MMFIQNLLWISWLVFAHGKMAVAQNGSRDSWQRKFEQLESRLAYAITKLDRLETNNFEVHRLDSWTKRLEDSVGSLMEKVDNVQKTLHQRFVNSKANGPKTNEERKNSDDDVVMREMWQHDGTHAMASEKDFKGTYKAEDPDMCSERCQMLSLHGNDWEKKHHAIQEGQNHMIKRLKRIQRSLAEMETKNGDMSLKTESMPSDMYCHEFFKQTQAMNERSERFSRNIQMEIKVVQQLLNLELGVTLRSMQVQLEKCTQGASNVKGILSKALSRSLDPSWVEMEQKDDPLPYLVSSRRAQTLNRHGQLDDIGGVFSLEIVNSKPKSCASVFHLGYTKSGVYTIWPHLEGENPLQLYAYCDMETDGGGWTVFQRRGNFGGAFENFTRPWDDYRQGFGKVSQEFWLGNEAIHVLSEQEPVHLRIEILDWNDKWYQANYSEFHVANESEYYRLTVSNYTGDIPDAFLYHNGGAFSTFDRNNGNFPSDWCVMLQGQGGGWWYHNRCYMSKLNSPYMMMANVGRSEGIQWRSWKGFQYSYKGTEMKLRPQCFPKDCSKMDAKTKKMINS